MDPPKEGFVPGDFSGAQVDLGLVVWNDALVAKHGLRKTELGSGALSLMAHLVAENAEPAAAGPLAGVQRCIGVIKKFERGRGILRKKGPADADACVQYSSANRHRCVETHGDGIASLLQLSLVAKMLDDDREFIATQSRCKISWSGTVPKPVCHGLKKQIAGGMTQCIVDMLEMI
jgi:hypothetical protein